VIKFKVFYNEVKSGDSSNSYRAQERNVWRKSEDWMGG
jgi:hypothetical protein